MKFLASIVRDARRSDARRSDARRNDARRNDARHGDARRNGARRSDALTVEVPPSPDAVGDSIRDRGQPEPGYSMSQPAQQTAAGAAVQRFQKEGAARPREVPEGGQSTRSDSVASPVSPFVPGGEASPPVNWQPEESSSVDGNVDEIYVSRQSDLATGRASDEAKRSTFASDSSGSGEVSRVQTSTELTSHDTEAEAQAELTTQQRSGKLEHRVEQRIRQVPGAGTPSEPDSPPPGMQRTELAAAPAMEPPIPAINAVRPGTPDTGAVPVEPQGARPGAARPETGAPAAAPAPEPRVIIGQVDVVVVSERGPAREQRDTRSGSFLSRNYLRRL